MSPAPVFWKKLALLLVSALTMMSGATIAASLPAIEAAFPDAPFAGLLTRLILTLPALGIVLFSPLAGWTADRYGRTPLLRGSLLLYAVSGVAGVWVESLTVLLISRFLLGVAISGSMTTAVTLIGDYFQGQERASFLGTQSVFMGFGGVVFIAMGGWLAEFSWHAPFWLYAFSLGVLPLAWLALNEPSADEKAGTVPPPLTGGAVPQATGTDGSTTMIGLVYAIVFGMMVVFYATPTQGPFYLTNEFNESSTRVGLAIAAVTLGGALGSLAFGRIKRRLSYSSVYVLIFAGSGLGYVGFGLSPSYELATASLFVSGLALGMLMPNSSVCLLDNSPADKRGRVIGGMTTSVFLGQFASPLLTQPLLTKMTARHLFETLGAVLLLTTLLATAAVLWRQRQRFVRV